MDQGKIVAIITGVISILIAIAYLVMVQLIDFRGEMVPAPIDQLSINECARESPITSYVPLNVKC
jgi:hypothetical protein